MDVMFIGLECYKFQIICYFAMNTIHLISTLCMLYLLGMLFYLYTNSYKVEVTQMEKGEEVNIMTLFREKGGNFHWEFKIYITCSKILPGWRKFFSLEQLGRI